MDNQDIFSGLDKKQYVSISFVCSGNTCRSYIAEAIATHLLKTVYYKKNTSLKDKILINSAGTSVLLSKVPKNSFKALDLLDVPNLKFTPSQIDAPLVRNSDLILTMATSHKNQIIENFGDLDGKKIFTLVELSNIILYLESEKIYRRSSINRGDYILIDNQKLELKSKKIDFIKPKILNKHIDYEKQSSIPPAILAIKNKIFKLKNINREILITATKLDIEDPFGNAVKNYYDIAKKIQEKIAIIFDYLFI